MELKQIRRVEWTLDGGEIRHELVPQEDVELLVEAVLKLHHDPGLNPHSGQRAAPLAALKVGKPRLDRGSWWSAPSLDDDGPRARLVVWSWETRFPPRA